jgi:hypothetical protein
VRFCAITGSSSAVLGRAALPEILEPLLRALPDALQALLCALPDALDALLGALPKSLDALLGALPEPLDALLRALPNALDAPSGALAEILNGALAALPDALERIAGVGQEIVRAATDVAKGLADALEELGVAIERGEDAAEDLRDVPQARLEECLRLDALDVELHLAEPNAGTRADLDEVPRLRQDGEMGPKIIQFELDLIDLHYRRV